MNFINYESISDKLVWLTREVSLSFTVKLGRKDMDGNRKLFQNEYSYPSKYTNCGQLISVKRNYDYYMVIDNIVDKDVYIQIRLENMLIMRYTLEYIAKEWLMNDSLWVIKNKKLMIKGTIKNKDVLNLPMGKWLSFVPVPILDYNNEYSKGVRIFLSDYDKFIDVNIDKFMELVYVFQMTNICELAAIMINYIACPDVRGINLTEVQTDNITNSNNGGFKGPNRTIQNSTKSFFDM